MFEEEINLYRYPDEDMEVVAAGISGNKKKSVSFEFENSQEYDNEYGDEYSR